jgi:hypothetical protein
MLELFIEKAISALIFYVGLAVVIGITDHASVKYSLMWAPLLVPLMILLDVRSELRKRDRQRHPQPPRPPRSLKDLSPNWMIPLIGISAIVLAFVIHFVTATLAGVSP